MNYMSPANRDSPAEFAKVLKDALEYTANNELSIVVLLEKDAKEIYELLCRLSELEE